MTWRAVRFRERIAPRLRAGRADQWARRKKRPVPVWATEVRVIPAGSSVVSNGYDLHYSHDLMPHCVEPMLAADDPMVRKIVLWFGIREGKTNGVCMNVIGRTITDDPGNIYSIHPTDDDAKKFSNDDVEPTIEACLKEYFVERKSRDSGRTVGYKRFRGGSLRIISAGSINAFRGTSVKVLNLHELDALNPESIYKAFGRTTGFGDAIIILESTCTLAPTFDAQGRKIYNSRIQEAYDQGDQRKWFCECRKCGALQWLKFDQIAELKKKSGEVHFYLCERCDADHNEAQWRKMAAGGIWYPTAALSDADLLDIERNHKKARPLDPTVRSYWRNGFSSLLPVAKGYRSKLSEFVGVKESMFRTIEGRKTWTNEIAAEVWDPSADGEAPPPWKAIFNRRLNYGLTIPQAASFLTAMVDVQAYRLEVEWRAWGRRQVSWGIDHVVLDGATEFPDVWRRLRLEFARKFEHESGAEMALGFAFIDAGKWPDRVLNFLRGLARNPIEGLTGKVRASKGVGRHGHPLVDVTYRQVGPTLKGHNIGTWEAKDRIYERLRMELPDDDAIKDGAEAIPEGFMFYNERYSEEFFQQLTAEQVTVTIEKGEEIRKYINPGQKRNEGLDLAVGNLAAMRLRRLNFDTLEADIAERAEAAKAAKEGRPVDGKEEPRRPRRSSWMSI